MPIDITMPALSPTMETGTLSKWLVKEGDKVAPGDVIAEIETDKATMEVELIDEGTVAKILVAAGTENVPVGQLIAVLAEEGEDVGAASAPAAKPAPKPEAAAKAAPEPANAEAAPKAEPAPKAATPAPAEKAAPTPSALPAPKSGDDGRIKASPLARRLAEARGIDLSGVAGSGPGGRIVKADLDAAKPSSMPAVPSAAPAPAPAAPPADAPYEVIKLSNVRKITGRRLTEAKQTIPHIYLTVDVNLDKLLKLRAELNTGLEARGIKLSVNDLLIKAQALALLEVPDVNVQFAGDELYKFSRADISVAVALDGGLITPIIRDAAEKRLSTIATEMKDLAARAKEGKLKLHEFQGGTASISNLGMYGIKAVRRRHQPPARHDPRRRCGREAAVRGGGRARHRDGHERHRQLRPPRHRRRPRGRVHGGVQAAGGSADGDACVSDTYDLIVLGSGPGGYVAAIRAAQLGLKTAIVEREKLGGVCLNWGCIPTKALLRTSEIKHYMDHASAYGLSAKDVAFDLKAVVDRSRKVAGQLNQGVTHLMKKNKIAVVEGEGTLTGKGKLKVVKDGKTTDLAAKHIIIATGARARELPHLKADGKRVWTYRHAMVPAEMPSKLLVIGSGAIGVEFASFYSDLGAKVTIVEMLDRVVPVEDADVSDFLAKALKKQGMDVRVSASVDKLDVAAGGVKATIKAKDGKTSTEDFSHVILAIGIAPNSENIGLEALGVKTDRGHLVTDAYGRTSVEGVWGIGDVCGAPWLAHKASHEGVVAVEAIAEALGKGSVHAHPMDKSNIPGCTYSRPQVASVGLTEAAAKEAGRKVKIGKFPFIGNGKAIALGEAEGFVKTVFDEATGELLGAHMVGAEVTELIQGYVIARQLETTEAELMQTIFAHPTLSEMMHELVLDAYGRALHY